VLDIECAHAAVVACFASPQALDTLPVQPGTHQCRVAPDELLLVAPPALAGDTERRVTEHFAAAEPDALVIDQSDGWCVFTLRGDEADYVFAQLSTVPLPARRPAFLQGAVAGGSAKIMVRDGYIELFVPSTLRHHVASRLQDVCRGRTDGAALRLA
jgi:sarcosine oxidase gamma subunit